MPRPCRDHTVLTKRVILPLLLAGCLLVPGCATRGEKPNAQTRSTAATYPAMDSRSAYGGAPGQLFDFVGDYARPITTDSRKAQQYFNQGLLWLYGFNHDEAVRSFTRAAELDPSCAMAWWGVAYAQGPNYNDSYMGDARSAAAWEAIQKALAQLDDETPVEWALIEALAKRYRDPAIESEEKPDLKAAFARAMADVWAKHPDDPEVGTFYADAMMLKHPWGLYKPDGSAARDETLTIVGVLEHVFTLEPYHPGANHLYIHAVEASDGKARGIAAADRLSALAFLSGHLNHMPAHIYVQVGMWQQAVDQNVKAKEADRLYLAASPTQYRQHGYSAHNGHMLAFAAMMVGREEDALAGARSVWDMPDPVLDTMGRRYDRAMCSVFDVLKRFGRWDAILAEPAPPENLPQATAMWRACRAIAFAAKHDYEQAAVEQAAFGELLAERPNDQFLRMNDLFIAGEIALQHEQWDEAIAQLEEAAAIEDTLGYGEPPRWLQPIRHTLGAVYLRAQRYADAERVYREDLEKWPGNGWSLFGLTRALQLQGKAEEAAEALKQFEKAWARADNPLDTSCECLPGL